MQINKLLKFNLGAWLKQRGEFFIWQVLIITTIAATLIGSIVYACNKFNEAGEILNTTSQIMLTETGIVIDNVNIESFQEAEFIINYKQKTKQLPDIVRNIFLFNAFFSANAAKTGEKI